MFDHIATESTNNGYSTLVAGGGITASSMLEWYADQNIQSECCFLSLTITASSHFHSSSLALLTA